MTWLSNLKFLPKLMLSFGLVMALTLALGVFSQRQLVSVKAASDQVALNWMPSIEVLAQIDGTLADMHVDGLAYVMAEDTARKAASEAAFRQHLGKFEKEAAVYVQLISSPEEKALWDTVKQRLAAYVALHARVDELVDSQKQQEATALATTEWQAAYQAMMATLDKSILLNHNGAEAESQRIQSVFTTASWAIFVALGMTFVASMGLAFAVTRMVTKPLNAVVAVIDQVAHGDLTHQMQLNRGDEIGDMQRALGRMMSGLSSTVSQVRLGADSVATASSQIAQGNLDLSSRTEEQASSLQQTAASVEQMAGTVRTNADNAHQANQLASAASSVAVRGGEVVSQVIETMNGIQTSSRKISDIIGVIDGIAFQTNILALNAAVEAARAGEQGRGFAVVASEVRSLAQRSAQAAREIKTLINDSVEKVNTGSELVGTAGSTMNDIVLQVRKVTDLVGEIAHASTEQSQGITQINQAINQLDQTTQQNAALVEESMAAAESLKTQAQRLAESVAVFRTTQSRDAAVQAQQVIQSAQRHSAAGQPSAHRSSIKAAAPVSAKPALTPARTATRPMALPTKAAPQLPAPAEVASASKGSSADDWETF